MEGDVGAGVFEEGCWQLRQTGEVRDGGCYVGGYLAVGSEGPQSEDKGSRC